MKKFKCFFLTIFLLFTSCDTKKSLGYIPCPKMDSNEYLKINIPSTIHYEGSTTKTHIFLKDGYTIDNILKEFDKNGY